MACVCPTLDNLVIIFPLMNGSLDLLGDPRRMKTWILIVILAIVFSSNGEWRVWKKDRRKYLLQSHATSFNITTFPGPSVHHSKIDLTFVSPKRRIVRKMIVDIHDYYRARVTPSASNMLKMVPCKVPQNYFTNPNILSEMG